MIWTRSFYSEQRSCQPALKKSETKEEDIEYEASTKRKSLLRKQQSTGAEAYWCEWIRP
jgi:hypothetical protein